MGNKPNGAKLKETKSVTAVTTDNKNLLLSNDNVINALTFGFALLIPYLLNNQKHSVK